MKKTIYKVIASLLAMSLMGSVLYSCEKEIAKQDENTENQDEKDDQEDDQDEVKAPVIRLELSKISVGPDEGDAEIAYTLENETAEIQMTAQADAEWISHIDATENGIITFHYDANPEPAARKATMNLVYGSATAELTISQEEGKVVSGKVTKTELIGEKYVTCDRWDLDRGESHCYLMDYESDTGLATDENGDFIWISVREYCEQYVNDYNNDPQNSEKTTVEKISTRVYDDSVPFYGKFTIDENHIIFEWGEYLNDKPAFIATMVNGDYTYNEESGLMKIHDLAIEDDPRDIELEVTRNEKGAIIFRYTEFYLYSACSYDMEKEYFIEAPTFFFLSNEPTR